jgi:hypothetical protein
MEANMEETKKTLNVNCGLACLLKDREGILDNYDRVKINCGTAIISTAINAKLNAKGAAINCGDMQVRDIKGEILMLDKGAVIDGSTNLKDLFIVAKDTLLITKDGMKNLIEAEGLIAVGTVFYPESADTAALIKISGDKRAYPDDAQVILGDKTMENIIGSLKPDKKHIWISGRLTALEKKALENIHSRGYTVSCAKLFTYEGLDAEYGSIINCQEKTLVPDGYEITGKISEGELGLYGKRIYVDGNFFMNENDIPALQEIESVIVKGKASLPASAVKIFKSKGKAGEYFVFEGRLVEINGFEQFSHSQLEASNEKGEKLSLFVNGCLVFDADVTAEDTDCIASLSYNGSVLLPGQARVALASKVKTGNGFMGAPAMMEELTGQSVKDLFQGKSEKADENSGGTSINLGTYILA